MAKPCLVPGRMRSPWWGYTSSQNSSMSCLELSFERNLNRTLWQAKMRSQERIVSLKHTLAETSKGVVQHGIKRNLLKASQTKVGVEKYRRSNRSGARHVPPLPLQESYVLQAVSKEAATSNLVITNIGVYPSDGQYGQ